jgi:hypothetical protein
MMNDVTYVQMLKEKFGEIKPSPSQIDMSDVTETLLRFKLFDSEDCRLEKEKFLCSEPLFRPINMDHTKGK